MKRIALLVSVLLYISCGKDNPKPEPDFVETKIHTHVPVERVINSNCAGFYLGLPGSYDTGTRKHPLILSLHGYEALGDTKGLSEAVAFSIGSLLQNGTFPKNVVSDGKNYSFIVVTPKFKTWPSDTDVKAVLDHIIASYRVDISRIYVSGYSMGGAASFSFGAAYPSVAAAIVPFSAARAVNNGQAAAIANGKLAVWAFHNEDDPEAGAPVQNTKTAIAEINALKPDPLAKMTIGATGGHDSWTKGSSPTYKEDGMNIYEWMLQYHR